MAGTDSNLSKGGNVSQRVIAVLDYDGIPDNKRASYLAAAGKCSLSTARRILGCNFNIKRLIGSRLLELADGLNVHWRWLYSGQFDKFDSRTARIQLVMIDGDSPEQADLSIGSISSEVPGEPTYAYVGAQDLNTVFIVEQHRRLTEWEKNKNIRFMIRLANDDPKANRLLEMCSRGQLSKRQVFHMV